MPSIDFMTGDDRWGCEVLLCLANPNGPRAVSECRPPIDKLFKCLSKRHPCKFPSCPMAGEGNYAKQLNDGFDPCSLYGLEDAPKGHLMQGKLDALELTTNKKKKDSVRQARFFFLQLGRRTILSCRDDWFPAVTGAEQRPA